MRTLVLVSFALLSSTSALAQKRLAVIDVSTPPDMMGLGAQVTQSVIRGAEAQGYTVNPPDNIRTQLGEKQYEQVQQCNGEPACVVAKLQGVVADRVVVGSLNRDEKNYLVKLWLIDLASGELVADVDRQILIASRRLAQDVNDAVPGLLRGEKEARGKVRITADAKGVSVTMDGTPAGKTPLLLELKPGKHELKAEKKAYYPIERYVTVTAGTTTDEALRMVKIPGEVAEEDVVPSLPQQEQPKRAELGAGKIPDAAMATGGAALVLAGAGLGFLLDSQKALDQQGEGFRNSRQYKLDQTYSTVLLAGAGLTAITAVMIGFVMDEDGPQLSPNVSPTGGGVSVSGSF